MQELFSILTDAGSTAVLIIYLIYRDKTFISRLDNTLTKIETYLALKTKKEGEKEHTDEQYLYDLINDKKVI